MTRELTEALLADAQRNIAPDGTFKFTSLAVGHWTPGMLFTHSVYGRGTVVSVTPMRSPHGDILADRLLIDTKETPNDKRT